MVSIGTGLIRSKLVVPRPATLLHRPRVCEMIERGMGAKLTLVSAPAGYGKTSALVDFAQSCSLPVCWYTADERDRDLGVFAEYLVAAIAERFAAFGGATTSALAALGNNLLRNPTAVAGELANEILALGAPLVLVVDNYEALDGALGVREFIHRLLEVLPANCHLMLGSRALPDVPVTRLVAKREMVGLRDADLRFSTDEVRELLRLSGLDLTPAQIEAICSQSDGWITGVLLLTDLARAVGARGLGRDLAVSEGTYEYLATDVLSRQPPDIQSFLLTSAVLREMSARMCRDVFSLHEAVSLLAEVERRNLFVARFGLGEAAVYRYHTLFRDFLQRQLRERDPARYTSLHLRAGAWCEQQDSADEAVYHYLAAEAYPRATALMERVAREWFWRGRVQTLLEWAGLLPESARSSAPWLSLYQAKVLTDRLEYAGARQALAFAEAGCSEESDRPCLAAVHNQRATVALLEGRYEIAIEEAGAALSLLDEGDLPARAEARRQIGRAYVGLGRLDEGMATLREVLALYREIGSPYDIVNLLQDLTLASTSRGTIGEAMGYLNEALAIARRLGAPALLAGVLNNLGTLHYDRGEYEEALRLYEEGLVVASSGGDRRNHTNILVGMADIFRDLSAFERAEPLYNAALEIAREGRPGVAVYVLIALSHAYRWQGDRTRAISALDEAERLARAKDLRFHLDGLLPAARGIVLAEDGDLAAGREMLARGLAGLERRGAQREMAHAHLLLAKAHLLAGERAAALEELQRSCKIGDRIGTIQFAVAEAQFTPELLELGISEAERTCRALAHGVQELRRVAARLRQPNRDEEAVLGVGRLEVYALGEGRVVREGRPVSPSEWQAATAKEMFFYLLMNGPTERDALGAIFFPDLSSKGMIDSFHTTIYRLRRALGSGIVTLEEGRYRIGDVDLWFDVREFERCVERARLLPPQDWRAADLWGRAVALYRGDFLPEAERIWARQVQERLHEMYIEALCGMARCQRARGDFEGAIEWYRRALADDATREDIHRQIMRCYEHAGRRAEAVAQYHRCREILNQELGVEPEPETQQLLRDLTGLQG